MDRASSWITGAAFAFTSAVGGTIPEQIREMTWLVLFLIVFDTITAMWAAALMGQIKSREIGKGLQAKILQFGMMATALLMVCIPARSWIPLQAALAIIMWIEITSLFENAVKLEKIGVSMGPFKGIIERVGRLLAVSKEFSGGDQPEVKRGDRKDSDQD